MDLHRATHIYTEPTRINMDVTQIYMDQHGTNTDLHGANMDLHGAYTDQHRVNKYRDGTASTVLIPCHTESQMNTVLHVSSRIIAKTVLGNPG